MIVCIVFACIIYMMLVLGVSCNFGKTVEMLTSFVNLIINNQCVMFKWTLTPFVLLTTFVLPFVLHIFFGD